MVRITTSGLYDCPAHRHDCHLACPRSGGQRCRFRTTLERGSVRSLIPRLGCRCRAWPTATRSRPGWSHRSTRERSSSPPRSLRVLPAGWRSSWLTSGRAPAASKTPYSSASPRHTGALYADENLLLAGTHTHSAPGGYSGDAALRLRLQPRRLRRGDGDMHCRGLRPCRRDGACQPRSRADLCQPWRGHRLWPQPLRASVSVQPAARA